MQKLWHKLLTVLFWLLIGVSFSFFVYSVWDGILLSSSYGDLHQTGVFLTGWNAGIISFDDAPPGYSGAQIFWLWTSEVYLTGIFWIQTVWWATFSEYPVKLIPPDDGENVRSAWFLSGYIWSDNAGWIALNHGESMASWVLIQPNSWRLAGYGYSDSLGWIPFWDEIGTGSTWTGGTGSGSSGSGVDVDISAWFIGKVDIAGSIWGDKTFDVLYEVWWSFNSASMTAFVNIVRRNVAFLIRNAGSFVNTHLDWAGAVSFNKAMIFKTDNNPSLEFVTYSNIETAFDNDLSRSLVVVWADIYIDVDILPPPLMIQSRAIIALKNEKGEWGNIWIRWSVKEIEATLFAEKTIWSWEEFITGSLSPYYVAKKSLFLDIPRNQLYIRGGVGWHNTIGWWSKDGWAVCPYLSEVQEVCNYDTAVKYDWNYFRIFSGQPARRAYPDDSKDAYSVIIEYDSRVLQDPPPGLETKK
jgi:hypothetical protein